MIGNGCEWCRDVYVANLGTEDVVDPVITSGSDKHVTRGFRYDISHSKNGVYATTTYRGGEINNLINGDHGFTFRVMCPITLKIPVAEEEGSETESDSEVTETTSM